MIACLALTTADYLDEAHAIVRRLQRTVWFTVEARLDPKTRMHTVVYCIFRRGMGEIATRSSPAALVAYLRKQLPLPTA